MKQGYFKGIKFIKAKTEMKILRNCREYSFKTLNSVERKTRN